jgi:hypothetical protein
MAQIYLTYQDNLPVIRSNLSDANGYLNLSSASNVQFIYRNRARLYDPITGSATILGTTSGYVEYAWPTSTYVTGGFYNAKWKVNYNDGTSISIPNSEAIEFHVSNYI